MNVLAHVPWLAEKSFCRDHVRVSTGSCGMCTSLTSLGNVIQRSHTNIYSQPLCMSSGGQYLISSGDFCFVYLCQTESMKWYLVVLRYIFLTTNEVEHIFISLLVICVSSSVNSFSHIEPFFYRVTCFFLLKFFIYSKYQNSVRLQITSQLVTCLFTFFTVFLDTYKDVHWLLYIDKFLVLMWLNLSIFSSTSYTFCVLIKKSFSTLPSRSILLLHHAFEKFHTLFFLSPFFFSGCVGSSLLCTGFL